MLQSNGAVLKFARARSFLYLAYCLGVVHKLMCLDLAILITYELYNALKWSDPAQAGATCTGLPFSCYCFCLLPYHLLTTFQNWLSHYRIIPYEKSAQLEICDLVSCGKPFSAGFFIMQITHM
jgi:hypothetical protein